MQLTKLHKVAAGSRDLDETARFYGDALGAHFMGRFDPPGLLFFGFAGTRLLLEKGPANATLYFWVDDIDAAHRELAAKGVAFDSGNILAVATQRPPR